MELLCPAGNLPALKAAIENGADILKAAIENGATALTPFISG
ncbi:hypothetical protein LTSEALA_4679 [Salmonella enterica subsp. enterica serovar Alachua str. R6-377]|uniref:Uncharacterized protein n=1 Tax=Salmonella enterica subsp. enterica serovar Alachua str. R6-377 TaxID=913241 RepID=G5LU31_SALET|nr:hypothetical protein LTSEALA_4679 [Salmonella enterica subsp. enterica serovar Alachua str. R6-377]